jgi:hypothetical protein
MEMCGMSWPVLFHQIRLSSQPQELLAHSGGLSGVAPDASPRGIFSDEPILKLFEMNEIFEYLYTTRADVHSTTVEFCSIGFSGRTILVMSTFARFQVQKAVMDMFLPSTFFGKLAAVSKPVEFIAMEEPLVIV